MLFKPVLVKNSRILQELKSSLYVEFNKEREGIHVSSLNLCLREVVFRHVNPKPLKDRDINVFTSGKSIHEAIQNIARYFPQYEIEKEVEYKIDGITIKAHIDLYDKVRNIPIEAKTVRKARLGIYDRKTKTWGPEEPKPFNVEQLQMYMTLVNADIGYIIYQLLLDFEKFPFKVFEIRMTSEEREKMLQKMIADAFHLQMNIDLKSPENTKHIANDIEKNWKCQYCPYLDECIGFRNKEMEMNLKNGRINNQSTI